MPLEDGAEAWANAIWMQYTGNKRNDMLDVAFERFDIENASKRLESFYLRLFERSMR